jgi:acyl carrier protein
MAREPPIQLTPSPLRDRSWDDIVQRIHDIVAVRLDITPTAIETAAGLEEMGADAVDMVEIIGSLEEAFGIVIPDEEVDRLLTVGDLVAHMDAVGVHRRALSGAVPPRQLIARSNGRGAARTS